jgi:hypothetical protein
MPAFIHGTQLLEAMQLCCEWPDGTLKIINWEAHRQALQTQKHRRTHFVKECHNFKECHNILPRGSMVGRYGQGLPLCCQLCKMPDEDFNHVICCPHQSWATWRLDFLRLLRKQCHSLSTDQALTDILLIGVEAWLTIPDHYHQIVKEQSTIGWNHIFQGRLAKSWAQFQQQHCSSIKPVKGPFNYFLTVLLNGSCFCFGKHTTNPSMETILLPRLSLSMIKSEHISGSCRICPKERNSCLVPIIEVQAGIDCLCLSQCQGYLTSHHTDTSK